MQAILDSLTDHDFNIVPQFDNSMHRFKRGDRKDKSGWYIGRTFTVNSKVIYVLSVGDWSTNESYNFSSRKRIGGEDNARIKKAFAAFKRKQQAELLKSQEKSAVKAEEILSLKIDQTIDNIDYLKRKNIDNMYGAVAISEDACIVIPVRDSDGKLWSIQKIYPDGTKKFLYEGRASGCYHAIKGTKGVIYICEGFATACSIHMATGHTVICAFNMSNLDKVAELISEKGLNEIIICGDNDQWTKIQDVLKNVGKEAATKIATDLGCRSVVPSFKNISTKPTDFNDLHCLEGLSEVKKQLEGLKDKKQERVYINESTGFYKIEIDEKTQAYREVPDYRELAKYMIYEKNFISDEAWAYVYKNGKYESIGKKALTNIIIELTGKYGKPMHYDNFIKEINGMGFGRASELISPDGFLNMKNGILDIETKELMAHSPKYFFKYKLNYDYDPNATCDRWTQFLDDTFEGNSGLTQLTSEIFGYTLMGGYPWLHKAFVLYGGGRNGKSTYMAALTALLGGKANISRVALEKLDRPFSVVALDGKLANMTGEITTNRISSDNFKTAVSGESLVAAKKFQDEYDFEIKTRFFFGANQLPNFGDASVGAYERLVIIPFRRYIKEEDRTDNVRLEVLKEVPGILNFALKGHQMLNARQHLIKVEALHDTLAEYREESDSVYAWCSEYLSAGADHDYVPVGEAYNEYVHICEHIERRKPVAKGTFGRRMKTFLEREFNMTQDNIDFEGKKTRGYRKIRCKKQLKMC